MAVALALLQIGGIMTIFILKMQRELLRKCGGYDDNSPINHVDKLKKLLLVHIAADDNVRMQNTMEMISVDKLK